MAGLGIVALTIVVPGAVAQAQAPGMPRTYSVQRVDSPLPRPGGSFGWGISSADLTGDNKPDLLVAQSQDATSSQVFVFDGATGAHIDTITPPELNPTDANNTNPDPALSFVYIETMPDIGSCPGGDGPDADKICDAATIGAGDGIPEILAGSRGLRVNALNPAAPPTTADPVLGRGYVIDGATRAVLKRIDMPPADRATQAAFAAPAVAPQFARVISSAQAMPPCAGLMEENNNVGVGPCPNVPRSTRIGDLNGDGFPDIIVTARNFVETSADGPKPIVPTPPPPANPNTPGSPNAAAAGSQCQNATVDPAPPVRCTSGKAWTYSGAAIAGSDPRAILDTPLKSIQNPLAQTGGQEFGGNLYRIGDVGPVGAETAANCFVAPPVPATCAPEYVIPARNLSYPLSGPFGPEFTGVGAAFLFNGATGTNIATPGGAAITSPEPQKLSQFSGSFNGGRAVGDLGASTSPDILLPAALQNAQLTDDGKLWAFNAVGGGGGATGSWQFASITDPTPQVGGNFGGGFTGVGNLVDGPSDPANEVLVSGFHFDPFTEATDAPSDLHFMNVQTGHDVMAIPDPDNARGDGFGVGLTPMGDLNGDGFLDFASSAYLANITTGGDGRAFIFTSDNSPLPAPPAVAPATPAAPDTPATSGAAPLQPGRCANKMLGTDAADTLSGTLAGDQIFAFAGADVIKAFQGQDCVDGAAGDDTLDGGDDNDKVVGGSGNDVIRGDDGRDELFGGTGDDRIDGGDGRDMLAGGAGNDRLVGGPGADRLFGEAGKDRIIGGSGSNTLDGGAGNDSIEARNGSTDTILCGAGNDRVRADRADKLSACERVTYGNAKAKAKS
jgi:Ca2+-binding RTX toxin-like protein